MELMLVPFTALPIALWLGAVLRSETVCFAGRLLYCLMAALAGAFLGEAIVPGQSGVVAAAVRSLSTFGAVYLVSWLIKRGWHFAPEWYALLLATLTFEWVVVDQALGPLGPGVNNTYLSFALAAIAGLLVRSTMRRELIYQRLAQAYFADRLASSPIVVEIGPRPNDSDDDDDDDDDWEGDDEEDPEPDPTIPDATPTPAKA